MKTTHTRHYSNGVKRKFWRLTIQRKKDMIAQGREPRPWLLEKAIKEERGM